MSITLWIVGSLLALVGGLWAHGNHMNCLMLEFEEFCLRDELDQTKDEGAWAYRSMQLADVQVAKDSNARNWYISRGICVLGVLLLIVQIREVL